MRESIRDTKIGMSRNKYISRYKVWYANLSKEEQLLEDERREVREDARTGKKKIVFRKDGGRTSWFGTLVEKICN